MSLFISNIRIFFHLLLLAVFVALMGCVVENPNATEESTAADKPIPEPQYFLDETQTHNKFSSTIPPVLTVPSGAVIKVSTEEASDAQLHVGSTAADIPNVKFDPIHPLTGPVYVENAEQGDLLKVTLHKVEIGSWGWSGIFPGFGYLADQFTEPYLKTFEIPEGATSVAFNDDIEIPLNPFPGVMGVAPDTEEMLSTIPPRANGGNMDNPYHVEGTVHYFPVFVTGGLFSIGDAHAAQGMGEVCGTAIEAPMTIIYEIELIKGPHHIKEPQYESDEYYAVSAHATTLDEAAKKATAYMVEHLVEVHKMTPNDAYVLCSLAGDLIIAEVVDVPNVLVSMHMPKSVFRKKSAE